MKLIHQSEVLVRLQAELELKGQVGFVPTMGALHMGHMSLVENSIKENDFTIVSIFVNPTQFNEMSDLENYPKDIDKDLAMLKDFDVDYVFIPSVSEMYPESELVNDQTSIDLGGLEDKLEGKERPGHFNGVVQIMSKLLELVQPNQLYLGQKDYQQVLVISRLIEVKEWVINVRMIETYRESNGLAMSSRNERLSPQDRNAASIVFDTLNYIKDYPKNISPELLSASAIKRLENEPICKHVEYFDLLDASTLEPILEWSKGKEYIACVAIETDKVRLIDNMFI
jgi:pantoate--beta-alanine ligase